MKRRAFTLGMAAGAASIVSGCGGGSSSGGTVFLKDVSGTWTELGGQLNGAKLVLTQSNTSLSGTLTQTGPSIPVSGTKTGNALDMTAKGNGITFELKETLVSGTQMSGTFGYTKQNTTVTVPATFTKP